MKYFPPVSEFNCRRGFPPKSNPAAVKVGGEYTIPARSSVKFGSGSVSAPLVVVLVTRETNSPLVG